MKKVLSFCVLSMLLAVLSLGLKAQSGLVLDPSNMPDVVLNQYDTIYISANSECFDSLGLAANDRVSIEWKVLYNGSVIPEDSLSYYFEDFKFESRYDLGMAEKWWGSSYTSHYCQNGDGYGSYPGANTPTGNLELGQQCEDPGHFVVSLPGQNNPYQFDFFFVKWFKDETAAVPHRHRLVYNIKVDGDYEIIFSIARRCDGSVWDQVYVAGNERYKVGGHMSKECGILSSDTLHSYAEPDIVDYYRCVGDSLVLGNPAVTFTVSTDTTVDPGYDSVFYMGASSCNGAIDSIVRFRVFFEDPSVPVLDTLNSTLVLCDSGQVSISVTTTAADKCIWLDETFAVLDTLDASTAFTKQINANTTFYVLGFNSVSGCVSSDTLDVYAEVFASPNPVVSAVEDTICENGVLKISLDNGLDGWTWFHDGTDMNLDTLVYDVADAAITDAGLYWAVVSENHVHSVYPTIDTIACSAADSVEITVFERPSVEWATLDGNVVTDSLTFCPNDLEHVIVATISGGQAPYDNVHWTGTAGTETYNADKSSDTLTLILSNTCGAEYAVGIDYAVDANGCTLKDTIEVTFFVNDTIKPTIAKVKDTISLQKYQDCQYIIPDVMGIITTSDNCGIADTTQVPAAGQFVTTDTIVIVTVTDLCGNTASDTIEVGLPVDELVVDTIEVTATVLCAGDANGAIRITVEGGTAPYDVKITHHTVTDSVYTQHGTIDQTIFDFDGLIAGKWDIEVTDTNECQVVVNDTADVAAPDILELTASDWTDLTCFESNDGSFKFNVKQGTTPYEMKIVRTLGTVRDSVEMTLNPSVLDTIVTMENQKAGVYVISVVDGHGCTATVTDTLTQPDELVLVGDTVLNHVKCFGESNGNLAVTEVTGGTYPYYYAWVNEAGDTVSTDSVTGRILPAGAYTIYITDANNCTPNQVLTDTIKQPEKALNVVSVNAPVSDTCPRLRTYTFDATVEGGRPEYEFEWTFNNDIASQAHYNATGAVADTFVYYERTISCDTTFEIIFKVTDDSACVAMDTIYFTIADTIAPTLAGMLDTLYIDGCEAADAGDTLNTIAKLQAAGLTISDNCTDVDALTVNFSEVVTPGCPIEVVRTYSVTDSCGLTSDELKHVIYVQDTTAPLFTCPKDTILYLSDACTVDTVSANVGEPTNVSDNCSTNLTISHRDEVVAGCGSTYTISRYWKVVDECGNGANSESLQTIQVQDTTPPVFTTLPVSRTYPCDGSGDTVLLKSYKNTMAGAVAEDNCTLQSLTMNEDSVVTGCNSATLTYYFSFTATDVCNNTTTVYATFNIIDTVAPKFLRIADDVTMECSIEDLDTIRIHSLAEFEYDDACSHHAAFLSDSLSDFNKGCGSTGFYTHYVTITDSCQTNIASHEIRIVDTKKPEWVQAPVANPVVECDGAGNLPELYSWLYSVSAIDSCSGPIDSITIYYVNALGENILFDSLAAKSNLDAFGHIIGAWREDAGNCNGFYRFIWSAVDSCGNERTTTEDFRIEDKSGPEFTQIRTNDTVDCGFNYDDFITWLKVDSAIDVCTNTKYLVTFDTNTFVPDCGNTGYYRVKWSVADTCGNATDPVYANWVVIDTTGPEITTSDPGGNLVADTIYRPATPTFYVADPEEHIVMLQSKAESDDFIYDLLNGNSIQDANGEPFTIRNAAGIQSIDECGWLGSFHYKPTKVTSGKACWEVWNIEYTFTDVCGNPQILHQMLYIVDTSAPQHNDIRDLRYIDATCALEDVEEFTTIEQANAYSPNGYGNTAEISDYLPGTIQLDSVRPGTKLYGHPCDSVVVRYYTISDQCGHDTVFTHTIYFRDTIAPVISQTELLDSIHLKSDCSTYSEIADENYDVNMLDKAWVENHFNITIQDCHDVTIEQEGADAYETDDNYCPGKVIVRRYKVTDACGEDKHSSYFTLRLVEKDTIAPTVIAGSEILPADTAYLKADCTFDTPDHNFANYAAMKAWNGGADVYTDCYMSDNGAVNVFGPFYSGAGCDSTVTYKYTVADSCGNMSSDTVTLVIHVLDTLAPDALVTTLPEDTVYSLADCSFTLTDVQFTDYAQLVTWNNNEEVYSDCNLGQTGNVTVFGPFGSGDACDTIFTYKYVVADSCGNESHDTVSISIHVLDTVTPVALVTELPADTVYALADCSFTLTDVQFTDYEQLKAWNNGADVYQDCNLGEVNNVTVFGPVISGDGCDSIFTYKYVVIDLCGNETHDTVSISIHVLDTVTPVALVTELPADTVYSLADCSFTLTDVQFTDYAQLVTWNNNEEVYSDCNLGQTGNVTVFGPFGSGNACDTIFTYKYVVVDLCGNESHDTVSISIHVLDTVAPAALVTTLPEDTVYAKADCSFTLTDVLFTDYAQLVAWNNGADVYNDCGLGQTGNVTVIGPVSSGDGCDTIFTYKYVVVDLCGNESHDTVSISIHVLDTLAPSITQNTLDTLFYIDRDGNYADAINYVLSTVTELNALGAGIEDCNLADAIYSVTDVFDTNRTTCVSNVAAQITRKYVVADNCSNLSDTITNNIQLLDTVSPWLDVTLPDYDAERTANACEFLVPDLHDTIAAHYVDNWSALTDYNQIPAAGYAITNFRDTVVMVAYGDVCGNMDTVYVNINVPDSLKIISLTMTEPVCFGDDNGTITVEIEGGIADYIYSYGVDANNDTISATTTTFDNLAAGLYTITVTDGNGCTKEDTISVEQPTQVKLHSTVISTGDICASDSVDISVMVYGGVSGHTATAMLLDADKNLVRVVAYDATLADTVTAVTTIGLDSGAYYIAFLGVDSHACTVQDTSDVITVHPTYLFEQTARVCHTEIVSAGGYIWVDNDGQTRKGGMIDASFFSTPDSVYTLYDSLQTSYPCDSVYVLHLTVTDKPFLKVRPLPTVYTPDISDAVEEVPERNFTLDSTNVGWEIFVDKNCMSDACNNPQIKVSLDYELYRYNAETDAYELMPDVSIFFKPEYRTFLDIYGMNYMPSSAPQVSCPSVYQNSGFNQEFDYYYLCWLDPEYRTTSSLFPSNTTLMSNGWYYQDGRANTIRITEFLVGGDYKIKVTLNKRAGGTHWGHTTVPMEGGGYPGGYDGSYVVEPYGSTEILFHVDGPDMPTPQPIAPIGGSVVYSSSNDDPQATVYPNPARDYITVEFTGFEGQTRVMLSNTNGKNLKNIELDIDDVHTTNIVKMETGNYAQGVYLITVRNNDAIITKRVVIIR